jgi:HK97 gp10 family phage protein
MPMGATITGFSEMQGKAKLLREAMRNQIAVDAVRAGATVIRDAMAAEAPVMEQEKTPESTAADPGALRDAIRMTSPRIDVQGMVRSLIGVAKRMAYLGRWIEYGHRLVKGGRSRLGPKGKYDPGRTIGFVPADPFLRRSYERTEREAIEAFMETARTEIREVLR